MALQSTSRNTALNPSDDMRMYLQQIGRTPLLSAREEVSLANKIAVGRDAKRRLEQADSADLPLFPGERRRLEHIVCIGNEAKCHLTEANLRLVVNNARRYAGTGLSQPDLVQAGNIGLMRAVELFDHTKGFKFSTYATHWIRQGIRRALADQSRTIRIPVHMHEHLSKYRRIQHELTIDLGRDPSMPELAEALEISVERAEDFQLLLRDTTSLDTFIGEECDSTLGELMADTETPTPAEVLDATFLRKEIEGLLGTLPDRDRQVIEMRFGLHDDRPKTLEDVGRRFGVTRERIRQIEAKALVTLRNRSHVCALSEFLVE